MVKKLVMDHREGYPEVGSRVLAVVDQATPLRESERVGYSTCKLACDRSGRAEMRGATMGVNEGAEG